jgi:hypothetical protein
MQGSKHSAKSTSPGGEVRGQLFFQVTQLLREKNLVFQFGARAQRDADELSRFPAAIAPDAFGEVAGNRGRCATHLPYQPIPLMERIALSRPIDGQHQFVGLLPGAKFPIVSQSDAPMASPSTLHHETVGPPSAPGAAYRNPLLLRR